MTGQLQPHADDPVYLTTVEVAARFRTDPGTVRYWRHAGSGPLGTKFGRRVLYALPDVEAWEAAVIAAEHGPRDAANASVTSLGTRGGSATSRRINQSRK